MNVHEQILDGLAEEFRKEEGVRCQVLDIANSALQNASRLWIMRIDHRGTYLGTLYAGADTLQFQWNTGPKSKPRPTLRVEYTDPAFQDKALAILREEITAPEPRRAVNHQTQPGHRLA